MRTVLICVALVLIGVCGCPRGADAFEGYYLILENSCSPNAGSPTGTGVYMAGYSVTVHANPNPGYMLACWTRDGCGGHDVASDSADYTFVMPSHDTTLSANYSVCVYPGEMIYIPAGSFLMGNSGIGNDAAYSNSSELPQHSVDLPGYYIGKYDVTRGEYRAFMTATGRAAPAYWADVQNWGTGSFTQTDSYPVVGVTYYDAEAFCTWAGGHLPTEAQWEKAARWTGSHPNVYPWGDTWDREKCNNLYDSNPAGGGYAKYQTSPVGSYPSGASPYGCMDMAGNVWQWVQDGYKSYPGSSNPFDDTNSYRVLRGGGWHSYYYGVSSYRCAFRSFSNPNYCDFLNDGFDLGFRLAHDAAPTGISLTLSPNQITPGQTVTAAAYAPSATSVMLSFSILGGLMPGIPMTKGANDTWAAAFNTSFLQAARSGSVIATAVANTPSGTQTASSTLWVGTAPTGPPPSSGTALEIFPDDRGANGLAAGNVTELNHGNVPLNAKLTVTQDLGMWFGVDTDRAGMATCGASDGFGVPELMGKWPLGAVVNPGGAVTQTGTFYQQGDSVTLRLTPWAARAAIPNMATLILTLVLGGSVADPASILGIVDDLQQIQSVADAANKLFASPHTTIVGWTTATASAFWSLKGLVSEKKQRTLLVNAFAKIGVHIGEDALRDIFLGGYIWDVGQTISPDVIYLVQTKGHSIDCTFQAYTSSGSGSAPQAFQSMAAAPRTSTAPPPAQTSVTWQATPSATDWLISYSVTNQGTNPVWSFSVFYEPSVGAPTAILDPPGWTHDLDATAGTVTWYTQGPGGWVNGDFGTAAIAPGVSLAGFGIRHTAPPDYSMCSSTDTGYGTCFGQIAAPAPAQGVSGAKMRMANDQVALSDKVVTAVFPDGSYYVEDPLRTCGIRVSGAPAPSVGDRVRIVGNLGIVGGEAQVNATTCLKVDTGTIRPLGMPAKALGGGSAVGIQQGITGASGLNNIGLLVRTWGKVTLAGRGWFYLDDGSGVSDGSGVLGIYVDAPSMSVPANGSYATVTGISSCDLFLGNVVNTLRPRSQVDITIVLAP